MPLTGRVSFKATVQKLNRFVVPSQVRRLFKLEADQVFKVTVSLEGLGGIDEVFYARMQRGGRIVVPRLHADFLKRDELGLEGHVLEVTIEPA